MNYFILIFKFLLSTYIALFGINNLFAVSYLALVPSNVNTHNKEQIKDVTKMMLYYDVHSIHSYIMYKYIRKNSIYLARLYSHLRHENVSINWLDIFLNNEENFQNELPPQILTYLMYILKSHNTQIDITKLRQIYQDYHPFAIFDTAIKCMYHEKLCGTNFSFDAETCLFGGKREFIKLNNIGIDKLFNNKLFFQYVTDEPDNILIANKYVQQKIIERLNTANISTYKRHNVFCNNKEFFMDFSENTHLSLADLVTCILMM